MAKISAFARYYLGTAQVRLCNLSYSTLGTESDDCTACSTSDLEHHLPALISLLDYGEILADTSIAEHTLYQVGESPKLELPADAELPCLHGQFRLNLAKKSNSDSTEDWWLVDLYNSGAHSRKLLW